MATEILAIDTAKTVFDRQALIGIYRQYNAEIFRYAYRMLGDRALAEDCVSETFSRFLHATRRGRKPITDVRPYLYRIAHNWVTDHFRRQPQQLLALEDELHPDTDANPSSMFSRDMERKKLRTALLELPSEQRQVIELRFLEEWRHQEIAEALGKSVEATRALQYRALTTLRRILVEQEKNENG